MNGQAYAPRTLQARNVAYAAIACGIGLAKQVERYAGVPCSTNLTYVDSLNDQIRRRVGLRGTLVSPRHRGGLPVVLVELGPRHVAL